MCQNRSDASPKELNCMDFAERFGEQQLCNISPNTAHASVNVELEGQPFLDEPHKACGTPRLHKAHCEDKKSNEYGRSAFQRLTTLATILCVIDCTAIPILLSLFSLLGMVTQFQNNHNIEEVLDGIGNWTVWLVMLPIASLSVSLNFYKGRRVGLFLWSLISMITLLAAHTQQCYIGWLCFGNTHATNFVSYHHNIISACAAVSLLVSNNLAHRWLKDTCTHACHSTICC